VTRFSRQVGRGFGPASWIALEQRCSCWSPWQAPGSTAICSLATWRTLVTTGPPPPGVTVVVRNVQTGVTQEFVTGETGRFTAASLRPGTYEVAFNLSGFNPQTVRNIELHVNDRIEINGKLGVGVTETVEVSAASQFVQPSPAVQSLMAPLRCRNFR